MQVLHVKLYFDEKLVAETSTVPFLLVSLRTVISSFPVTHRVQVHSYTFRLFILHMLHWLCEITNEEFTNKIHTRRRQLIVFLSHFLYLPYELYNM